MGQKIHPTGLRLGITKFLVGTPMSIATAFLLKKIAKFVSLSKKL